VWHRYSMIFLEVRRGEVGMKEGRSDRCGGGGWWWWVG